MYLGGCNCRSGEYLGATLVGPVTRCWNGQEVINVRDCPPQPTQTSTQVVTTSVAPSPVKVRSIQPAPQVQKVPSQTTVNRQEYIPTYQRASMSATDTGRTEGATVTTTDEAPPLVPVASDSEKSANWLPLAVALLSAITLL